MFGQGREEGEPEVDGKPTPAARKPDTTPARVPAMFIRPVPMAKWAAL